MEKKVKVNFSHNQDPSKMARIVQTANEFESTLYIKLDHGRRVNVKSIMGMMSFVAEDGQEVTIQSSGGDEAQAAEAIVRCLSGE